MCHRLALSRNASAFTVVGQDERGHGIGGRGRILKAISRRGAPLSPLSSAGLADPALGNVHAGRHLPRLLATLTANAVRDLLADVPGGTGTIGAAAWAIETVVCGAFAVRRWVEPAVADAGRMGPSHTAPCENHGTFLGGHTESAI